MTSCRTVRNWIFRELERELPVDQALELDRHVATCAECGRLWARAQRIEDSLLALAEPPVEHVDVERNLRAIRKRMSESEVPRTRRARRWIGVAIAAVGALAAAVLALVFADAHQREEPSPIVVERTPVEPVAPAQIETAPREEPVHEDVGPIETATVEPIPESDREPRFERERYDAAREALRVELAAAALPELAPAQAVRELALRVDSRARELALAGWPIHRLAASLFDDADPAVARAAIRYVGLEGDRLALLELERRAADDSEALLALVDAGAESSAAIATACGTPGHGALVRSRLAEWPLAKRIAALEAALRAPARDVDERGATLDALARCGGDAVEPLVRLAQERAIELDSAGHALASIADAPRLVVELATRSRERIERDLLVDFAARLRSPETLDWLEAQARDPRARPAAVRGLIAYATPLSLDRMLGLSVKGWIGASDLEAALRELSSFDAARIAGLTLAHGERTRTAKLLDALVARADHDSVLALARIAASASTDIEEREIAIRAAGEFGTSDDVDALIDVFHGFDLRQRRLAAVCVEALMRLGGEAAVERALAGAPRRHTERVLDVFARPSPGSVSLVQLARALEPVLQHDLTTGDEP